MTPPLYETPAPPSSSIQVTFAFFVGTSENRIARLPRYPDSPNMALALHAARRPTLLFEFLDYPHQSLNFLFLESFVVQPQLRIGGSIGIQRDQSKAYLPLSTSKCLIRSAPLHWGAIVRALFTWTATSNCPPFSPSMSGVGGLLELYWNFIGVDRNFIGTVSLRY